MRRAEVWARFAIIGGNVVAILARPLIATESPNQLGNTYVTTRVMANIVRLAAPFVEPALPDARKDVIIVPSFIALKTEAQKSSRFTPMNAGLDVRVDEDRIDNLVAGVHCYQPGQGLILNGHLMISLGHRSTGVIKGLQTYMTGVQALIFG